MSDIERIEGSIIRHRPAPQRVVGTQIVVARPADGNALELNATAGAVWTLLADWCSETELERQVVERYPNVDIEELRTQLTNIVRALSEEGLLERSCA